MVRTLHRSVTDAAPLLVITVVRVGTVCDAFSVTKPSGVTSEPSVHASVLAIPGVGFLGHALPQALVGGREAP